MRHRKKIQSRGMVHAVVEFAPFPTQLEAISDFEHKIVLLIGGWKSGKSTAAIAKFLANIVVNAAAEPGTKHVYKMVAPSFSMLREVTWQIFESLASSLIVDHNKLERRYLLRTGDVVYYGSSDNPQSLEGSSLNGIYIEEIQDIGRAALRIVLSKLCVVTPVLQLVGCGLPEQWLRKDFDGRKDTAIFHLATSENKSLDPTHLQMMRDSLSSREIKTKLLGQWGSYDDSLVYPEYDPARHVVRGWEPDTSLPVFAGVDFGYRFPAVIVGQQLKRPAVVDGKALQVDDVVFFAEFVRERLDSQSQGRYFAKWLRSHDYLLAWAGVDPSGTSFTTRAYDLGMDYLRQFREGMESEGIDDVNYRYLKSGANARTASRRSVHTGISQIRHLLDDADHRARIYFAGELIDTEKTSENGVLTAITKYRYPPGGGNPKSYEKKGKFRLDILDAMRYALRHLDDGARRNKSMTAQVY